ncbi:MAG TPA: hypothetical protein VFG59_06020, partial [Anaeromyxobacter sp.]|nr:hypothetical protein [Anaeromyxobacter sp.]
MSRPVRHYGKWRIRWVDEDGRRHSEVYDKREDAVFKLREHEHRVQEIRRSLRLPDPLPKTFDDLADHWLKTRAVLKRSRACDESIIRAHLRPAFGGKLLSRIQAGVIDEFCA